MLVWVVLVFFFGSADRVFLSLSIAYDVQLWLARGLVLIAPALTFVVVRRWCQALQRSDAHPLRAIDAELVDTPAASPPPARTPAP